MNKSEKFVLCNVFDEIFRGFFPGLLALFVACASIFGLKNGLDCKFNIHGPVHRSMTQEK
jgi:hypothetical protein